MRKGRFVKQEDAYWIYLPETLDQEKFLEVDPEIGLLLSQANSAVGRLDGVVSILEDQDFIPLIFTRYEAVLSSQVDGFKGTLDDVLRYETERNRPDKVKGIGEVMNYVHAINTCSKDLEGRVVGLDFLREIHAVLLKGVVDEDRSPGEFRKTHTWIGPKGSTLENATFIPPPIEKMYDSLENLVGFLREPAVLPNLIRCAVAHAQFESIHPFPDGNGRVGRILISLLLIKYGSLKHPVCLLSGFLKNNREEYFNRLMAIRNSGDWEGWLRFFLSGVIQVSEQAVDTIRLSLGMKKAHLRMIEDSLGKASHGVALMNSMFVRPVFTIRQVQWELGCSYVTASKVVDQFLDLGLLHEMTGWQRNRRYRYKPFMDLFSKELREKPSVSENRGEVPF